AGPVDAFYGLEHNCPPCVPGSRYHFYHSRGRQEPAPIHEPRPGDPPVGQDLRPCLASDPAPRPVQSSRTVLAWLLADPGGETGAGTEILPYRCASGGRSRGGGGAIARWRPEARGTGGEPISA